MVRFFITLYHFLNRHKFLLYASLLAWIGIMTYCATQVKFEENITSIFPRKGEEDYTVRVFDNLRIKDKIIVMFSLRDTVATDTRELAACADAYDQALMRADGGTHIAATMSSIEGKTVGEVSRFVRQYLPLFLSPADFARFDTITTPEGIAASMSRSYMQLLSPIGGAIKENVAADPVGLSGSAMTLLRDLQGDTSYEMADGHIFSADGSTLLLFISPRFGSGYTGKNEILIREIESTRDSLSVLYPDVNIEYFGGPSVAVYNARQIKRDTLLTLSVALLIIVLFILSVFKRKVSILLMLPTVGFGALFALTVIYLVQGSVSSIAIGIGSVILGISLSYSIHMLAHQNHVKSVEQLIEELTLPLTIGSFTTIGAFFALIFTSSELLHDLGLFASMTLVGTTLFCLIYLPHFLRGDAEIKQNALLRGIERINAYPYDRNKYIVTGIILLAIVCSFFAQRVTFDSDMMALSFEPPHLKKSEERLEGMVDPAHQTILFVSVGKDFDEAAAVYARTNDRLRRLQADSLIWQLSSAERLFIPSSVQEQRLQAWNEYWTPDRKTALIEGVEKEAGRLGFKRGAFDNFARWLENDFALCQYDSIQWGVFSPFAQWYDTAPGMVMLLTQVNLSEDNKEEVYKHFADDENVVVFDRAYFTNRWVDTVNDDFNYILFVSSVLIFIALLISYGRIELTLISFLPMCISWIIIVGIMGLLDIRFNIVNIILSTFIFGIGDDFSIFIMDGLQNRYMRGNKLLNSHKTAIFFSAFTTVVGMGAMVFALHPALQSLSLVSIIGMMAVVLVAYTIEPVIFNLFIGNPASKKLPPYTLWSIIGTAFFFIEFFIGCLLLTLLLIIMLPLPIARRCKQYALSWCAHKLCRGVVYSYAGKKIYEGIDAHTFDRPAVIIANHASFIDILLMFALTPRIIMVTNKWVYHSPVFGHIIRYLGFHYTGNGYDTGVSLLQKKTVEGYSIVVFPEGTRSCDGKLHRFHKGAFYLAEQLHLDILPLLFYGPDKALPKRQSFHLHCTTLVMKALPRITPDDTSFGTDYRERTKQIAAYCREQYAELCRRYNTPDNPYFYNRLVRNFIYKGPVLEWYTRIKVKMEDNYRLFDHLIPDKARITDIGCGYGYLGYMLAMYSPDREILGIDYDADKIAVANNGFARPESLQFVCADSMQYDLPPSDVFVLNDMLHYLSRQEQRQLLLRCAAKLNDGGTIIVRDGNATDNKHGMTRLTELFSTRILHFNKTVQSLQFITVDDMRCIADECGMKMSLHKNDRYTSNTIYILKR